MQLLNYMGSDRATFDAIGRVIDQLPEEPMRVARHACFFLSIGGESNGLCLRRDSLAGAWEYVILIFNKAPDLEYTIAHEIAHVYLGHLESRLSPLTNEEKEGQERDADDEARKWGFVRS